jgi:hypothetical protein
MIHDFKELIEQKYVGIFLRAHEKILRTLAKTEQKEN